MQHKTGNSDMETVSQTGGEEKRGEILSKSARKRRPGGLEGRKWDERKELWEEKEDEEWLKPK